MTMTTPLCQPAQQVQAEQPISDGDQIRPEPGQPGCPDRMHPICQQIARDGRRQRYHGQRGVTCAAVILAQGQGVWRQAGRRVGLMIVMTNTKTA
jgi:hypothetical protein